MKYLITTIAALVLVGCGKSQESAPSSEATPVDPVAKAATPEPTTAKAPSISIHDAVLKENIEAVKLHLDAGTDVNTKGGVFDTTPLIYAAWFGYKEVAELLVAKGADVNAKGRDYESPLHHAASSGHKEIAEVLIAKGADLNAKRSSGETPLHQAADAGHKEIAKLLIANGVDVNAKDHKGETSLDFATNPENQFKSEEFIDLLRKHGGKTAKELKAAGN